MEDNMDKVKRQCEEIGCNTMFEVKRGSVRRYCDKHMTKRISRIKEDDDSMEKEKKRMNP